MNLFLIGFVIVGYKLNFNVFLEPSMEGFTSNLEEVRTDKVWVMTANPEDKDASPADSFEEEEDVEETKELYNIVRKGNTGSRLVLCCLVLDQTLFQLQFEPLHLPPLQHCERGSGHDC